MDCGRKHRSYTRAVCAHGVRLDRGGARNARRKRKIRALARKARSARRRLYRYVPRASKFYSPRVRPELRD